MLMAKPAPKCGSRHEGPSARVRSRGTDSCACRRCVDPSLYGRTAAAFGTPEGDETWEQALRQAQAQSTTRSDGRASEWLPTVVRALLDEVIVPRRRNDASPIQGTYFRDEIREARRMHKEWARAQLNGLPSADAPLLEWIVLTRGQRPDLAAQLASGDVSAAEAGLRLGYGGRIDPRRDNIFGRLRNNQISRSEAILCLARRRLNVLWAMQRDQTSYQPGMPRAA